MVGMEMSKISDILHNNNNKNDDFHYYFHKYHELIFRHAKSTDFHDAKSFVYTQQNTKVK